ncbi:PPOX class F420-dependent oxidoreductase [Cellulomonas citrea]|uniref:PPOX class F420-dependent oxidoreductase n=1 Tax=Cellulomonas citrea TaxID=1909423 RepID=UPI001359F2AC|nr:PPOX class F420-dependent oxidoreductase [Cellulomonas citrea]
MTTLLDLADAKYVLLTTFRRTGEPVQTPVWAVRDGDGLAVTTLDGTGKVKRLRHTPRATVQVCDMRGRVAPDAPVVPALATIDAGPTAWSSTAPALVAKYGLTARFTALGDRLRRGKGERVVLRLRPA